MNDMALRKLTGMDSAFILNSVLWKSQAKRKKTHLAFLDLTKAYDSVARHIGKETSLRRLGMPEDLTHATAQGVDMFDCVIPTRHGRRRRMKSPLMRSLMLTARPRMPRR